MTDFEELFKSTLSDLPRGDCNNYCCTTCGGQYGKVQDALSDEDQSHIYDYLKSLSFTDFRDYGYMTNRRLFVEHLLLSAEILTPDQAIGILSIWESKLDSEQLLPFTDFVLFYFIRYLPKDHMAYLEWVEKCRTLVTETDDYSLLESLVLVEGKTLPEHIREKAIDVATYDDQMRRAFTNAFGHKEANLLFSGG